MLLVISATLFVDPVIGGGTLFVGKKAAVEGKIMAQMRLASGVFELS